MDALLLAFALATVASVAPATPAANNVPHVLVLHSYHAGNTWTDDLQRGLAKGVRRLGLRVQMSVEYMDAKRFPADSMAAPFEALLRAKYDGTRFNTIVVSDNSALLFLLARRDTMFRNTPVVFVGVNNYEESGAAEQPDMTGVVERADFAGTLDIMCRMHPELERIVAVADVVPSARLHLESFRKATAQLPGTIDVRELVGLNVTELREALRDQPPNTAVLLLSYYRTPEGRQFEAWEATRLIASCGLPVYSMWDTFLGSGIVGGSLTSGEIHGRRAAGLLARVIWGEPAGNIPVVWRSPSVPMFDYRVLERLSLPMGLLPEDAEIINQPHSQLYRHRKLVALVTAFIVIQALVIVALGRSVTRRHAAEAALRTSEARFRAIAENTSELTLMIDGNGYCTYISPAVRAIGGRDPEHVVGRLVKPYLHPDDADLLENMVTALRKTPDSPGQRCDFRVRHADGHYVHLEALFTNMANVPEVGAIVINCRDISERIARERTRRQQALVFETINDGVIILSPHGEIMNWNHGAEEMFGYSRSEVVGRDPSFLHPSEHRERLTRSIEEGIAREGRWRGEIRFVRKDGTQGICETVIVPLAAKGEPNAGRVGVNRDVTRRREAERRRRDLEAKVQQSQKFESLGVLAGGIAHDFNNLLMGILGQADLALMDLPPNAPVRRNLQQIETASRRAADLSRQMLAYSGRGRFVVDHVDVNQLVGDALSVLRISVPEKTRLEVQVTRDRAEVEGDATQLRQVISNLVTNASEAMEDDTGKIVISTRVQDCRREMLRHCYLDENLTEGRYVVLEVRDTGRGIPPEMLTRVFDPFFTTKFTGRGLGLAAVLGIARGHGGGVCVSSEPGRDTKFEVLLPLAGGETPERPHERKVSVDEGNDAKAGTVLLVDDEQAVRDVARQMLQRAGFRVLTATNGREALGVYEAHAAEIVCVILDMTMPVMDGKETFQEIRKMNERVRIVMSSGYNEQEVKRRFAGQRPSGFVQKPYESADLLLSIHEALASTEDRT